MTAAQQTVNAIAQQRHYYYLQLSTDSEERSAQIERMREHGANQKI